MLSRSSIAACAALLRPRPPAEEPFALSKGLASGGDVAVVVAKADLQQTFVRGSLFPSEGAGVTQPHGALAQCFVEFDQERLVSGADGTEQNGRAVAEQHLPWPAVGMFGNADGVRQQRNLCRGFRAHRQLLLAGSGVVRERGWPHASQSVARGSCCSCRPVGDTGMCVPLVQA
ncbi:MAG: hypothetical protein H0V56_03890 [Chthoniobacterales bacterium]|nr:hypothetical protein [Chthoniobacterales bacterium]